MWVGSEAVFVAVVDPTSEDRDAVANISYFGRAAVVVPAKYSEAELRAFQDLVVNLMPHRPEADEPYVFGVGFGVRDNDWSASGQYVVSASVTSLDPQLLARIRALVPDDALEIRLGQPPRRLRSQIPD